MNYLEKIIHNKNSNNIKTMTHSGTLTPINGSLASLKKYQKNKKSSINLSAKPLKTLG
jgi:hypothetical protein